MTTHEASKESQAAAQPEAGPSGAAADANGEDGQEKKPGCSSCEIMRRLFEGPCGDQVAAFVACYQKKGQDEDITECVDVWKAMDECRQRNPDAFADIFPEMAGDDDDEDEDGAEGGEKKERRVMIVSDPATGKVEQKPL
eukprot:tig00000219_g19462.t1